MFRFSKFIAFFFGIFFFISDNGYSQQRLDSIFVNWNVHTIHSLEQQFKAKSNSTIRNMYENRLSIINEYLKIPNVRSVNAESIRYKFLIEIFKDNKKLSDGSFYIVEANELGSKVVLRSFLVRIDSSNNAYVDTYTYANGKWCKQGQCIINGFSFNNKLGDYINSSRKGFNYDDIIITKIEDAIVRESVFFLYGTLSADSQIKKVLNCYQ